MSWNENKTEMKTEMKWDKNETETKLNGNETITERFKMLFVSQQSNRRTIVQQRQNVTFLLTPTVQWILRYTGIVIFSIQKNRFSSKTVHSY